MTLRGADLIAFYLSPDRLPVQGQWSRKHAHTQRRLCERFAAPGARSPACAAMVHPLRLGIWLITAPAYLPACSHGSVRAKHGRSRSSSSARFRRASAAPILAAAAAFGFAVLTNT
jgi:hypothetical protein